MKSIRVSGGFPLKGELTVQGSKNAVLPILAGTILNRGTTVLHRVPRITDVYHTIALLQYLGCQVKWEKDTLLIQAKQIASVELPSEIAGNLRSSITFMGALLARTGEAQLPYPGGCSIGARPIDLHLTSLQSLGVNVKSEQRSLSCWTNGMKGNFILLPIPSVGATENILLTAALANGTTTIEGAAKEPEIDSLIEFLNILGAKIRRKENHIQICGVQKIEPKEVEYTLPPDRIVAGTYLMAATGAGGNIVLHRARNTELGAVLNVLQDMGAEIKSEQEMIHLIMKDQPRAVAKLVTRPYPGFPTDLQSQLLSVLTQTSGTSILQETIFEDRYHNFLALQKMGADILLEENCAKIRGVSKLQAAQIEARDLRGGAGLVIAGLMAKGTTKITGIEYVLRGYEDIVADVKKLGGDISWELC